MQYYSLPSDLMGKVMRLSRRNASRTNEFAFTLARALTYRQALVTEGSPEDSARATLSPKFDQELSMVNALLPVNISQVRDFAKGWAILRHSAATGCCEIPTMREGREVEDFFGLSKVFDKATIDSVKEHADNITEYALTIACLLKHKDSLPGNDELTAIQA